MRPDRSGGDRSALVSQGNMSHPHKRCSHCKKSGHTVDCYYDLHPEQKNIRRDYKGSSNKKIGAIAAESSENRNLNEDKKRIFDEQNRELQTYLGKMDTTKEGDSGTKALNHALATHKDLGKSSKDE
ncbi:unnamed protein product [Victoria cruziana]